MALKYMCPDAWHSSPTPAPSPPPQNMANEHANELGMQTVPSLNIAYTKEQG